MFIGLTFVDAFVNEEKQIGLCNVLEHMKSFHSKIITNELIVCHYMMQGKLIDGIFEVRF